MAEPVPALILGSGSPRRRDLLAQLEVAFEVLVAPVDEAGLVDGDVHASVERTSVAKFEAFDDATHYGRALLTADTLVAGGGAVLGKPTSRPDAEATLRRLSGQELTIVSAVCAGKVGEDPMRRTVTTSVRLRRLGIEEIRAYVATGAAADKAGALELQGRAAPFMDKIDGCWSNVVGLPLCATAEMLAAMPDCVEMMNQRWLAPCRGVGCGASRG